MSKIIKSILDFLKYVSNSFERKNDELESKMYFQRKIIKQYMYDESDDLYDM